MPTETQPTRTHRIHANGLEHPVYEWGSSLPGAATALLLHGFMDAGGTWDLVAPRLQASGLRVLAPDLRGFGRGARASRDAYYHFPEYVADVAGIAQDLVAGAPLLLVGHSMGGSVAAYLAGSFPELPTKLALLEGLGPPSDDFAHSPDRMRRWVEDMRRYRSDRARPLQSMDDALARLRMNHPRIDDELLRTRVEHLVTKDEEGRLVWAADPVHRAMSAVPFFAEGYKAFAARIQCPTLLVSGGPLGFHPPDEAARAACFRTHEQVEIEGAGHMIHWTRPEALADHLVAFWAQK